MTDEAAFNAALPLTDPAKRAAYLAAACPDAEQRARVGALLAAHDAAGTGFLERHAAARPEVGTNTRTFSADTPDEAADESDPLLLLAPPGRPDSKGRIGHYEVLQVLGRGGFGAVYRAFDEVLHRVVAVKVLLRHIAATSPARKRFLREARTLAQVRHENVVQVYEVGETPLPYLVMEFVPGETLQARLDRVGPVEPAEVVRIGRQLAEGLAAAHATGLVHRDIKPGNVLLEGPQLHVKITDFGLARAADDASISQSGLIAGTPLYMAPEQAKGDHIDHRADLFSLGSVLYQMLSGRPPFRASNTLAVLKRVCEDDPRPIREIIPEAPKWLCDIISKLHAKDPDQRFQTAREVADVLAACEDRLKSNTDPRGFPKVVPPEQTETVAYAPPARKPKWRAAALALALVAGAAALLVSLWPGGTRLTVAGDGVGLILTDEVDGSVREVSAGDSQIPAGYYRVSPRCSTEHRIDTVLVTEGVLTREVGAADFQVKWNRGDRVTVTVRTAPTRPGPAPAQPAPPTLPASYTGVPPKVIRGNDSCITYQYSPDGKWLVTRDYANNTIGAMRVWEVATGEVRATIPNSLGRGGAFSPDSKLLAHPERDGGRMHFVVRNVGTFDVVKRWPCETKNVEGITFDRTSSVVAACVDYDVVLWTARTGAEVLRITRDFNQPQGLAFSPTADRLLLQDGRGAFQRDGRWDHNSRVHLYDVDPKSPTFKQSLHTWEAPDDGYAFEVHFSPNGAHVLFCRGEGEVMRVAIHDAKTGAKVRDIVPQQSRTQITVGAVSPDGKRLVLRHGQDGVHVGVWNLDTGERVIGFDLTGKAHRAFAVDPTFRTACIGFHTGSEAKFYDLATGKELVPGAAQPAPKPVALDPELARVSALPPNEQLAKVRKLLVERNPMFDGALAPTVENNVVVKLELWTDNVSDLSPLRALAGLKALAARGAEGKGRLTNLSPLQGLPLELLDVNNNGRLADLTPLTGLPLKQLFVQNTAVRDLAPLAGLRPTELNLSGTPVADLAPLRGAPLVTLYLDSTKVADLTPLRGMPLKQLNIRELKLTPARDGAVLRGLTALESINSAPVADFFKALDPISVVPFTDEDAKRVAALPAKDQVEAVRAELKKRNPNFDGPLTPTFENEQLVGLTFPAAGVTDLSPLRGVPALRELSCSGERAVGTVTDLSPLKGMKLTKLTLSVNPITDLSPLKGMPLTELHIDNSQVADLSPLAEMPLKVLNCSYTRVTDLAPLKNLPLRILWANNTDVANLAPLKAAPLEWITFQNTKVTDTSVLKGKPLSQIYLDFDAKRDGALLRGIPTLERINDKPATEFLKEFGSVGLPFTDADVKRIAAMTAAEQLEEVRRELKKRNPGYDGTFTQTIENDVVVALRLPSGAVSDLSPVRALTRLKRLEAEGRQDAPGLFSDLSQLKGLALTELWVRHNRVADLTPLKGMPLQWLWLDNNPVTDFAPLKAVPLKGLIIVGFPVQSLKGLGGLKIESLDCSGTQLADLTLLKDMPLKGLTLHATPVSDLAPLKGMRLNDLNIERTKVSDLSPLVGMPLADLNIVETEVTDLTPIKGLPLKTIVLDFKPERDAAILKGIKTLELINRKPAAEFWKANEKK